MGVKLDKGFHMPVVNATLACLAIHVKLVEVVVHVRVARAQVATKQRGVRGEECGHGHLAHAGKDQTNAHQPLVEVDNRLEVRTRVPEVRSRRGVMRYISSASLHGLRPITFFVCKCYCRCTSLKDSTTACHVYFQKISSNNQSLF